MAQGLHSAAFTPVQRSRKVQDSFTIGKQMSKPLLSFLFKNAHAHTRARTHRCTHTHHAHARWGCHYTGSPNKPGNPRFQVPIQCSTLFFLILKKLHQIKTTCQNNNNKNHTVIPRVVKKDKWDIQFRRCHCRNTNVPFSKQTLQDFAGKQNMFFLYSEKSRAITFLKSTKHRFSHMFARF